MYFYIADSYTVDLLQAVCGRPSPHKLSVFLAPNSFYHTCTAHVYNSKTKSNIQ